MILEVTGPVENLAAEKGRMKARATDTPSFGFRVTFVLKCTFSVRTSKTVHERYFVRTPSPPTRLVFGVARSRIRSISWRYPRSVQGSPQNFEVFNILHIRRSKCHITYNRLRIQLRVGRR